MGKIDYKKKNIPFTQVANAVLNDAKLSFKAKGLFAYLYSKPDGWDFESGRIAEQSTDGRDSVRAGLVELEQQGYLKRYKLPNGRMVYEVCYPPMTENPSQGQKPMTEKANDGKSHSGETRRISNKENKVIKSKSNKDYVANATQAFSLDSYIKVCYDSPHRHVQLIALYMDYKKERLKKTIKTKEQAGQTVKRHLKAAKELMAWTDEQLNNALADLSNNAKYDWTLESVLKELTK